MSKFKITMARIERSSEHPDSQVCITFRIRGGTINFQVAVPLKVGDYDDTEMVEVARSILHRTFAELATQTRDWNLSPEELRSLSGRSLRPRK